MTSWVIGIARNFEYEPLNVSDRLHYGDVGSYYMDWHRTGPTFGVYEFKPSEGFLLFNNGICASWSQVKLLLIDDLKIAEARHAVPEEKIWLDNHAGAIISYIGGYPGDPTRKEKACLVVARDRKILELAIVLKSLKSREVNT